MLILLGQVWAGYYQHGAHETDDEGICDDGDDGERGEHGEPRANVFSLARGSVSEPVWRARRGPATMSLSWGRFTPAPRGTSLLRSTLSIPYKFLTMGK